MVVLQAGGTFRTSAGKLLDGVKYAHIIEPHAEFTTKVGGSPRLTASVVRLASHTNHLLLMHYILCLVFAGGGGEVHVVGGTAAGQSLGGGKWDW